MWSLSLLLVRVEYFFQRPHLHTGYCISSNDKWHKSAPASAAVCRLHTPGARELCQCTECGSNTSLTPETATTHYANSLAFFALPALRAPALVRRFRPEGYETFTHHTPRGLPLAVTHDGRPVRALARSTCTC